MNLSHTFLLANIEKIEKYDIGKPTVAMNEETSRILKEALFEVVNDGTGIAAKSDTVTSVGKTATAQTGRKDKSGTEITNNWFCGFFPAEDPIYTVIVFSENIQKQSASCAEVFAEIADRIYTMENKERGL